MKKNRKHLMISLLLICVFAFGICVPANAGGTEYADKKVTIRVAFYPLEGFFEYDENGRECGYGVDYLNELTKYANIKFEYVPADSWEGIKEMMLNGQVDMQVPVSEPVTPSQAYDYTVEPIMTTYHTILTRKERSDLYYQDYESIAQMKLAVVRGLVERTGVQDYLESIGAFDRLIYYEDYNSCREALDEGEVDGLITNIMDLTDDLKILDKFSVTDNYIITLKGNSCYTLLNHAMTQLKLEEPSFQSNLYEQYYPERNVEPFTQKESAYIAQKDHLTVAVYTDRKPVSFYDENTGSYQGIAIDVVNKLSEKTGIPITYIPITTDSPTQMLEKADLVMPVAGNEDAQQYFVTSSILDSEIVMAIRSGEDVPEEGEKVAVLASTSGIAATMKQLGQFEIEEYHSSREALEALQKGEVAGYANSAYVINWMLENPHYSDLSSLHYQSISLPYDMCGKSEDSILESVLNKGIHAITEKEINQIIQTETKFSVEDLTLGDKLYIYRQQIVISIVAILLLFLGICYYSHSRTRYIRAIEKSSRQKEKANRAKSDFLARMSHDIRTPLNVILGMSQLAKENDNPKDTNDCLEKIDTAGEFLLGLINDVLDMEHIESGKMELNMVPYSGEEFSQYIDAIIRPLCVQKNINFEYSYNGSNDFVILQDRLRINQIYFNLLSNAVKFTPEGGSVVFHTDFERTERNTIKMEVTISDTGIGMSEEFMKHMFEPFSQENQVITPIGQGTGLGLSIVKRICELMDMEISVKSRLGQGTTFLIHGEYKIVNEVPKVEKVASDGEVNLKDKVILVCEDHPLNQEIIQRILNKKGAVVVMADNGKRGIEVFAQSNPGEFAAILMDIRMPVMNGLQASAAIRKLPRTDALTIPIIALTANAYEEDVKKCREAGMNAHLAKPVEPKNLYNMLGKYI